jgi:hypothetical protein
MRKCFLCVVLFCGCYNMPSSRLQSQEEINETIKYVNFLKQERKKLIKCDNARIHRQIVGGIKSIDFVIERYENNLLAMRVSYI